MKTKKNLMSRIMLVSLLALLGAIAFSSCDKKSSTNNTPYTISGNASGAQMVPAVSDSGTAAISGSYDPSTRVLSFTTNWMNLTGAPTSAGFYSGASGKAGAAVGDPWTLGSGLTSTGNTSGTITLTSDQGTQLINGDMYYVLGTSANTAGEVRGQITATR